MSVRLPLVASAVLLTLTSAVTAAEPAWQLAKGPLMTRWAKDVSPENVHPEYPRPQMVREKWTNLNGLWDYAIRPAKAAPSPPAPLPPGERGAGAAPSPPRAGEYDGKI